MCSGTALGSPLKRVFPQIQFVHRLQPACRKIPVRDPQFAVVGYPHSVSYRLSEQLRIELRCQWRIELAGPPSYKPANLVCRSSGESTTSVFVGKSNGRTLAVWLGFANEPLGFEDLICPCPNSLTVDRAAA